MWFLYECLLLIGFLLYLPKALWRRRLPHQGWSMRLGRYPQSVRQRVEGRRALWVHAVSVGEVLAAEPLVKALAQADPASALVVSTITSGGFDVASKRLAAHAAPVYFPLDLRVCVARSLNAFHPCALLLMESELWPAMIRMAHARGVPIAVVNGRISTRAFGRYRLVAPWLQGTMRRVNLFAMQSRADADRAMALGAPPERVHVLGSFKWDASLAARPDEQELRETAQRLGVSAEAPLLVAGSTHRGEEAAILEAFKVLRRSRGRLRVILAPRHLERLEEVERLVRQSGLSVQRLSTASPALSWDVGLVDTFGQLPRFYGLATVAFVGGSLIPHGGQNPLEPAGLGAPVIFGPFMHNFQEIAEGLLAEQAARRLSGTADLLPALEALLADADNARRMGARAKALTERSRGVVQRTLEQLQPLLRAIP